MVRPNSSKAPARVSAGEIMSPVRAHRLSNPTAPPPTVNVQVALRVRPLSLRERADRERACVQAGAPHTSREVALTGSGATTALAKKTYTFDRVFGPASSQDVVYETVCRGLVDEVLQGYNCTVFAYGQTGTGKTFTMEGTKDNPGVIPRAVSHIFDYLRSIDSEYTVRVSHLELYNEVLSDLLSAPDDDGSSSLPTAPTASLRIYEDSTKGTFVQGLDEVLVRSESDIFAILAKSQAKRKTAETAMNAASSRSHSVFSLTIHIKESTPEGEDLLKVGKLNLVDLAGSESIGKSGAVHVRAREAGNINTSLLTLGRVITALVERHPHVPYRDSKLTRLLQESLGGRNKTCIIATVGPAASSAEETASTLEYANRAKSIKNRPTVNQLMTKRALIRDYTDEIQRLKAELDATRSKNGIYVPPDQYERMKLGSEEQRQAIEVLTEEKDTLHQTLHEMEMSLQLRDEEGSRQTAEIARLLRDVTETNVSLTRTKGQLVTAHRDIRAKDYVIGCHLQTERALVHQTELLRNHVGQANRELELQHGRLQQKVGLEAASVDRLANCRSDVQQILVRAGDGLSAYEKKVASFGNEIRGALKQSEEEHVRRVETLKSSLKEVFADMTVQQDHRVVQARELFDASSKENVQFLSDLDQLSGAYGERSQALKSHVASTVAQFTTELESLQTEISGSSAAVIEAVGGYHENLSEFFAEQKQLLGAMRAGIVAQGESQHRRLGEIRSSTDDAVEGQAEIVRRAAARVASAVSEAMATMRADLSASAAELTEAVGGALTASEQGVDSLVEHSAVQLDAVERSMSSMVMSSKAMSESIGAASRTSNERLTNGALQLGRTQTEGSRVSEEILEELSRNQSHGVEHVSQYAASALAKVQQHASHVSSGSHDVLTSLNAAEQNIAHEILDLSSSADCLRDQVERSVAIDEYDAAEHVKTATQAYDEVRARLVAVEVARDPEPVRDRREFQLPEGQPRTAPHEELLERFRVMELEQRAIDEVTEGEGVSGESESVAESAPVDSPAVDSGPSDDEDVEARKGGDEVRSTDTRGEAGERDRRKADDRIDKENARNCEGGVGVVPSVTVRKSRLRPPSVRPGRTTKASP